MNIRLDGTVARFGFHRKKKGHSTPRLPGPINSDSKKQLKGVQVEL